MLHHQIFISVKIFPGPIKTLDKPLFLKQTYLDSYEVMLHGDRPIELFGLTYLDCPRMV